jgi:hypothetical protein
MVRAARQGVSVNQTETALWWARARAAGPQRILPGGPAPAGMRRLPEPDGSGAWLLPVLPDNASAAVLDELGLPGHVLEHPNDTARVLAGVDLFHDPGRLHGLSSELLTWPCRVISVEPRYGIEP